MWSDYVWQTFECINDIWALFVKYSCYVDVSVWESVKQWRCVSDSSLVQSYIKTWVLMEKWTDIFTSHLFINIRHKPPFTQQTLYKAIVSQDESNRNVIWRWEYAKKHLILLQPKFRKCWDVFFFCFFWIKWKLKDFQITWANILFTIEHREHNKCLNWEIWHFYPLNELISNLMPATGLKKKLARGQQRAENARHFEKIQLGEHLATN